MSCYCVRQCRVCGCLLRVRPSPSWQRIGLKVDDICGDDLPIATKEDQPVDDTGNHLAIDLNRESSLTIQIDLT